jgi:hypothetical protein
MKRYFKSKFTGALALILLTALGTDAYAEYIGAAFGSGDDWGFIPFSNDAVDYMSSRNLGGQPAQSFDANHVADAIIGAKDFVGGWNQTGTGSDGATATAVMGSTPDGQQYWGASYSVGGQAGGVVSVNTGYGSYQSTYTAGPSGEQCQCNFDTSGDYFNGDRSSSCYGDCGL